jgi:dihydroneopterin aldolase
MLKDLLCLVDAHAHVTTLAPALTQRVIETLAQELAHALLRAFTQIQQMGLGAMLSVSTLSPDKRKSIARELTILHTGDTRGGVS